MERIRVENFSFSFGQKQILHNLNFHVCKGEVVGFLGENGVGKTTLLHALYGLYGEQPNLRIADIISSPENSLIQKKVSFIQDAPVLLDYLTGIEYLDFLCRCENIPYVEEAWLQELAFFEMLDAKDVLIKKYSFGMKKKIQILSEMKLHKPICLFDEPTNGLDIKMILNLKAYLQKIKKEREMTLILSSHNASFLKSVCDRVLLFHGGVLLKDIPICANTDLEKIYLSVVGTKEGAQ